MPANAALTPEERREAQEAASQFWVGVPSEMNLLARYARELEAENAELRNCLDQHDTVGRLEASLDDAPTPHPETRHE